MLLYHGTDDPSIPMVDAILSYEEFGSEAIQLDYTFEKEEGLKHNLSATTYRRISEFYSNLMNKKNQQD